MALSPSETTRLLRQLEHRPNKKLGQNFLIDGNLVEKSISMADLPSGIPVLEIGPGLGTLTQKLLSLGHAVFAVEIDRRLEKHLREELAPFVDSNQLNLLRADAVKYPTGNLPENIDLYAVVANLPYAISSAWMEGLLGSAKLPTRMVMMLQKKLQTACLPMLELKNSMPYRFSYNPASNQEVLIRYPGNAFTQPLQLILFYSVWTDSPIR